jgi:AraC-like DNA-binding protein
MLQGMVKIIEYRSLLPQTLRDVPNHQPSLIRIIQGTKRLIWQENAIDINADRLIILPAGQAISFVNQPNAGQYRAQQLLLPNHLPGQIRQLLAERSGGLRSTIQPTVTINDAIDFTWGCACRAINSVMYDDIKQQYCYALLLAIADVHPVNLLYPSQSHSLTRRITELLQWQPDKDWQINDIADRLAMSPSTLRRRLKHENTGFRQLLTECRLGHALALMQERRYSLLDIAGKCGYLNQEKFSARFKRQFGLTPSEYCKTL